VLLLERPPRRGGGEHPVTGKADRGESAPAAADLVPLGHAHRYQGRKASFEEHSFRLRVAPDADPTISDEHVAFRWVPPAEARAALHWNAHKEALALAVEKF